MPEKIVKRNNWKDGKKITEVIITDVETGILVEQDTLIDGVSIKEQTEEDE